jgi:S-adenosylmethionine synthetase
MGHPDKVADQISDAILDFCLSHDPTSRVACETLVTTDLVVVAGEVTTAAPLTREAVEKIARATIKKIGYTDPATRFSDATCEVQCRLHTQSGDISMGVDTGGAGDQGMMFGFACDETASLMPLPIHVAHRSSSRTPNSARRKRFPGCAPTPRARSPSNTTPTARRTASTRSSYRPNTTRTPPSRAARTARPASGSPTGRASRSSMT